MNLNKEKCMENSFIINRFDGKYSWLSNFYTCKIKVDNIWFSSVENAYQASKEIIPKDRLKYVAVSAAEAKKLGKKAKLRHNWDEIKLNIMEELIRRKFKNPDLKQKLLDTGNFELVEGNCWGDTYWGVCNGVGKNHLGKILMKVREEILKNN